MTVLSKFHPGLDRGNAMGGTFAGFRGPVPVCGLMARVGRDSGGSVAVIFALIGPLLFLMAGGLADYVVFLREKTVAQKAADAASIAGAKELSLADANKVSVPAVVAAVISAQLAANGSQNKNQPYTVATEIIDASSAPMQVTVRLVQTVNSVFGERLGLGKMTIKIASVATVVGKPNICVLALDPSSQGTLLLEQTSTVTGQNCGVYSNSTHPNGLKAWQSSTLTANVICSAGGHGGTTKGNYAPRPPINDCPQFSDPLAARPEPTIGGCAATNLIIANQTVTLSGGTYCGGIKITGTSVVTLNPGIYIMSNGPLMVQDTASLTGTNTGFFFSGNGANFTFTQGSTVNLTAPKDGNLAGLLFFASRSQNNLVHTITSDNARQLLGTLYIPSGTIQMDSSKPIADLSHYTAIVARKVTAVKNSSIILNTNYDLTDVPVPAGIRGAGQPVRLTK
jgi:Flp pilus assembly protein TadG